MRIDKIHHIIRLWALLWALASAQLGLAQSPARPYPYADYLRMVLDLHPEGQLADLQIEMAEAAMLRAKGGLDPKIEATWARKSFEDKLYYDQIMGKLKVPTQLGIDVVAGYERNDGDFLNPENKVPDAGLWSLGVEVDVLQGLLVNQRRLGLERAELQRSMALSERQLQRNDLAYDASMAYLNWQLHEALQVVLEENLDIATSYFANSKAAYMGGEKTAMDTLEAYISVQAARARLTSNAQGRSVARLAAGAYVWNDASPAGLQSSLAPESLRVGEALPERVEAALPQLTIYELQADMIQLDQRLYREQLKPRLTLRYNPLLYSDQPESIANSLTQSYKLGVSLEQPLWLRKERGSLRLAQLKLDGQRLKLRNKRNQLAVKRDQYAEQHLWLVEQLAIQEENIIRYRNLLEAELVLFDLGESSVFLTNKRQEKYIGSQIKRLELLVKLRKAELSYRYITNTLIRG